MISIEVFVNISYPNMENCSKDFLAKACNLFKHKLCVLQN